MVITPVLLIATMLTVEPQAHQQPTARTTAAPAKPKPQSKAEQAREKRRQDAVAREQARQEAQAKMQQMLALQVALDRAGFSMGVIDGREGANTTRAIEAYRSQKNGDPVPSTQPLNSYQITEQDAAGPFATIPRDMMEQSKLPALSYRSVAELLAERFHTTPEFLKVLNPTAQMVSGETITVPNVEPFMLPSSEQSTIASESTPKPKAVGTSGRNDAGKAAAAQAPPPKPPVTITVSRSQRSLTVTAEDGKVLFFGPVTTGSEHDPLPLGNWKVTGIQYNPPFRYNPALFWDANPSHTKAKIPPGPNGPVGVVWMALSKEHYGIHGSPEPSQIGRTESHGCVRLTNWDATRVAGLVSPGTLVRFVE
jgi:lipoprotein-anchoring transpeptidase ErfK/SrfK